MQPVGNADHFTHRPRSYRVAIKSLDVTGAIPAQSWYGPETRVCSLGKRRVHALFFEPKNAAHDMIDAYPARPRKQQPKISKCVKWLVELDKVIKCGHSFQVYFEYRDQHVDDHRY